MTATFHDLGVSAPACAALARLDITAPFPVQERVVPAALAGDDVLVESPTGSGKTLAFGLPLLERAVGAQGRPSALVLVPTRELASQVATDLRPIASALGLRVAAVFGGASLNQQAERARSAHVLVATPGRLDDLLTRRRVSLDGVVGLVLDEADRMLDMGFRPQVDRILERVPAARQTMLFSATLEGEVDGLARAYTVDPTHVRLERVRPVGAETVEHSFVAVTADDKHAQLVEQLGGERGLALVFVRTKHGADRLARRLERHDGLGAVAMHGNLTQRQRERALQRFGSGEVSILVATDVAARGLDVDDITHVINFDPPGQDEDYVHRVGRTGRAGRGGRGITLVLPEQRREVGLLAGRLGHARSYEASGLAVRDHAGGGSRRGRRR
ncbi:MAG: DEAD/DEAH box helicase [Acidimicrobiales bacterium]